MYLIVGLGNPGKEYENNRHNLGFKVIDKIASYLKITEKNFKSKCQSFIAETIISSHKVILAQPQTLMNNSGQAVRELLQWHKINPSHLILIYDDVDLEVGEIRVRPKGSSGGHHGVESVIAHIGTSEFTRVRIGIGRDNLTGDVTEYVLQNIPPAQKEKINSAIVSAADAVYNILK